MLSRPNVLVRRLRSRLGGAKVNNSCISGVWLEGEGLLSFNQHKLLSVERGLRTFRPCLVAVFFDNTAAVSYLRRQGGTLAPALNVLAQRILR